MWFLVAFFFSPFFWLLILGAMGGVGSARPSFLRLPPPEERPSSTHTHVGPRAHSPANEVVVGGGLALIQLLSVFYLAMRFPRLVLLPFNRLLPPATPNHTFFAVTGPSAIRRRQAILLLQTHYLPH